MCQNERFQPVEICQNERFQPVEIYQTADISTNIEMSIDCILKVILLRGPQKFDLKRRVTVKAEAVNKGYFNITKA